MYTYKVVVEDMKSRNDAEQIREAFEENLKQQL